MEFTLAAHKSDSRGNRRYFTLASSPTEAETHLGVKFPNPSSSFKRDLLGLQPGSTLVAGQLAGDFTLPRDQSKKLVFMAGGIGVTPFRSMLKYLSDRGEKRDIVLMYSNQTRAEIAYKEIFEEAERQIGLKTIYALTNTHEAPSDLNGPVHLRRIDADMVQQEIPDYLQRLFYVSGTHAMTDALTQMLRGLGVPRAQIKTDFFPGF